MQKSQKDFLFRLLNTPSPTVFEAAGQKVWTSEVKRFADKVETDAYGNAWATLKGKTDRILMFEAHADEIGFMVKHVTKEGFIHVDRIGGSDWATARGRRLVFFGDKGEVRGVIGNTAIHIRDRKNGEEKAPEVHELYVDVGAKSDKAVAAMGLRVGHPAVYADSVEELGKDSIIGRALDNRLGSFIIAEVLRKLSESRTKPTWTVIAVNAVQEEIGSQGAQMITPRLKPDVALVFDVTHSTDTPGIDHSKHGKIVLGDGPTVTHGSCNHPAVVERLMTTAKAKKIPLQHEASSRFSGTDTGAIYYQNCGIPSALVSIPLRYMHSVVELVRLSDVDQVIELLTAFAAGLKEKDGFTVKI